MTENGQTSIVEKVNEARYQATFTLHKIFGTESAAQVAGFAPVINAILSLPEPLMDDVGGGIVKNFFETEGLDPQKGPDRETAQCFADVLATSITVASNAIFQQLQQQAIAAEQGRPRILSPMG